MVVNKNTKIWVNYLAGGAISVFLLWSIYAQVHTQLSKITDETWRQTSDSYWLWLCIGLMFVNTSLEGVKWFLLTRSVEPLKYSTAFSSYLAGIAFSIVTPNRIGEYPGRILYLGRTNTFRYINVSISGIISQLSGVYFFGLLGLIYYNVYFPETSAKTGLVLCFLANVLFVTVYWKLEAWLPLLEKIKWLKKYYLYGRLLKRVTTKQQVQVLALSLLRCFIFTAQYLFLLRWMNVDVPLGTGFCMAALFFWVIAIIPTIAFTGLIARASVSVYLFQHFSQNTMGILAATAGVWLLNLVIPSIIGSILIFRMRLLR